MTVSKKIKVQSSEFVSSRQWSENCLVKIKQMQDEYLDRYFEDKKGNNSILSLLQKLVELLEKKLN